MGFFFIRTWYARAAHAQNKKKFIHWQENLSKIFGGKRKENKGYLRL